MRRVWIEFAATLSALAAVQLYLQLQDPTSWLRLHSSELRERLQEWQAKATVDDLIDSVHEEVSK